MCSLVGNGHISGIPAAFKYRVKASGPRSPTYTGFISKFSAIFHHNERISKDNRKNVNKNPRYLENETNLHSHADYIY